MARVEGLGIVSPSLRTFASDTFATFAPIADLEHDRWETRVALTDVADDERYGGGT